MKGLRQNSNGWVLDSLALALTPTPLADRPALITWLAQSGYHPDKVALPMPVTLVALLSTFVSVVDQWDTPPGVVSTVTQESLVAWLPLVNGCKGTPCASLRIHYKGQL